MKRPGLFRGAALAACALAAVVSGAGCLSSVGRVFVDIDGGEDAGDSGEDGTSGTGAGEGGAADATTSDASLDGDATVADGAPESAADGARGLDGSDAPSALDTGTDAERDGRAEPDVQDASAGFDASDGPWGSDANDAGAASDTGADTAPDTGADAGADADAGAQLDGAIDAAPDVTADASDAGAAADAGGSVDAADAGVDAANPAVQYACGGNKVSDCSSCNGKTENCVFCAADGGTLGVCAMAGANCYYSLPATAFMCPCVTSPSVCPMSWQWCAVGYSECHTCGETGSGLKPCKVGSCNQATGVCQ